MAVQANEEHKYDIWYVDRGCSNHMGGSKSSFSYLNGDFCIVKFDDCSIVNVIRKDNIKIKIKNGFVETISNIFFYVPHFKTNLFSAKQLQEKGYVNM